MALTVMSVPLLSLLILGSTNAAELSNRSISVSSSAADEVTSHTFTFNLNNVLTLGSLEMEYCTNSPFIGDACVAPVGLTLVGATMGPQSGVSGFTIHPNTTVNRLVLGRIPAGTVPVVNASITINSVTNPSTLGQSVFVRISTYATNNGTGARDDSGAVVFSVTKQVTVSGFVPPFLIFCAGVTVASDCSSATGNYLSFGELSTTSANTTTSQFAVATNDAAGYITTLEGTTLTSGNNTIPSLASPTSSSPGVSQFGLNLRSNSSPSVGANVSGIGFGVPYPGFNIPNNFSFGNVAIAFSPLPTEYNVFTVSYVANASEAQKPGVYNSTLTYVATALF